MDIQIKKYMVFIDMDNIEHDINVLKKILNSPLFLDKYPFVSRVWVDKYGELFGDGKIDIVLGVKDLPGVRYSEYSPFRDEIKSYIRNLAKMAGVTSELAIYP